MIKRSEPSSPSQQVYGCVSTTSNSSSRRQGSRRRSSSWSVYGSPSCYVFSPNEIEKEEWLDLTYVAYINLHSQFECFRNSSRSPHVHRYSCPCLTEVTRRKNFSAADTVFVIRGDGQPCTPSAAQPEDSSSLVRTAWVLVWVWVCVRVSTGHQGRSSRLQMQQRLRSGHCGVEMRREMRPHQWEGTAPDGTK